MFFKFKKTKKKKQISVFDKQIVIGDVALNYKLRLNPRCKSIRLAISSNGDLAVSTHPRISIKMIENFINLKKDWLMEKVLMRRRQSELKIGSQEVLSPENSSKEEYQKHKNNALKIAMEKVEKWNLHYKFKYNKISIKNQKTRWGSCSRHGNLNFSYKIALLPNDLADYLVVHELCHLGEFNHSHKFWALVAQTIPDYQKVRRELKGVR